MKVFTDLEAAVLKGIAAQYPDQESALLRQFAASCIDSRANSGAGFFTNFSVVQDDTTRFTLESPIGDVWAEIEGLENPMGFLLFLKSEDAFQLEGFTVGDATTSIAFDQVAFKLLDMPEVLRLT